ncbi:MAG: GGDEF domain-containing protein [Reinekea sp.]
MNHDTLQQELQQVASAVEIDPQSARLTAEKAISWSQRNGWIDILALANLVSAQTYAAQRVYRTAIDYFQRAKTLFKDLSDTEQVAKCHAELGRIYYYLAEYSLAIDHLRKALAWVSNTDTQQELAMLVRIRLAHSLLNMGYWSDAEQELTAINQFGFSDILLVEYQMAVLRLIFYRSDQRAIREQLQLCRELVLDIGVSRLETTLHYYTARYNLKYGKFKHGEQQLSELWNKADETDRFVYFLLFEAAMDVLQSDFPQKGIQWLTMLADAANVPLLLKQRMHLAMGDFFVSHLSYKLATEHFQSANILSREIRENEVRLQWARFRADDDYHLLQRQVAQQKQSNQILAESNALLQAVNRIALSVNSAPDLISLVKRLRDQLVGWIEPDMIMMAELKGNELHFDVILEDNRERTKEIISMDEERSWSVRAVREGRILYKNDFSLTDEIKLLDSASLVQSIAFIPLVWESQTLGVLSLQSRQPQMFDVRSISLLEYIKPVIGIAFSNMLNLDQTRQLSGELIKQRKVLTDVQQMMEQLSEYDELTGLPNRKVLPTEFEHWREHGRFQCMLIRIRNHEEVIRKYGYMTADILIREIGNRLSGQVREQDVLIRSSEDQFLILIPFIEASEELSAFANSLMSTVIQPLTTDVQPIQPEAAIGVVQFPDHGETLAEMMSVLSVAVAHADQYSTSIVIVD